MVQERIQGWFRRGSRGGSEEGLVAGSRRKDIRWGARGVVPEHVHRDVQEMGFRSGQTAKCGPCCVEQCEVLSCVYKGVVLLLSVVTFVVICLRLSTSDFVQGDGFSSFRKNWNLTHELAMNLNPTRTESHARCKDGAWFLRPPLLQGRRCKLVSGITRTAL